MGCPCQILGALQTKSLCAASQRLATGLDRGASIGDTHIRCLRTGACRGLRVHAPGISPIVHLSLVEHPLTDPGCHLLVQTVQAFRRHANPDQVSGLIEQLLCDWNELLARAGPSHVLLTAARNRMELAAQWLGP